MPRIYVIGKAWGDGETSFDWRYKKHLHELFETPQMPGDRVTLTMIDFPGRAKPEAINDYLSDNATLWEPI